MSRCLGEGDVRSATEYLPGFLLSFLRYFLCSLLMVQRQKIIVVQGLTQLEGALPNSSGETTAIHLFSGIAKGTQRGGDGMATAVTAKDIGCRLPTNQGWFDRFKACRSRSCPATCRPLS